MAIKQIKKKRLNASGEYDLIHYETDATMVLMDDGSTVEETMAGKSAAGHTHKIADLPDYEELESKFDILEQDYTNAISTHNTATDAHEDIRTLIDTITPKARLVTLSSAGWDATAKTQTVSCLGVVADEGKQMIMPAPTISSTTTYNDAGVQLTGQAADTLTFTTENIPTTDVQVYIVMQNVEVIV